MVQHTQRREVISNKNRLNEEVGLDRDPLATVQGAQAASEEATEVADLAQEVVALRQGNLGLGLEAVPARVRGKALEKDLGMAQGKDLDKDHAKALTEVPDKAPALALVVFRLSEVKAQGGVKAETVLVHLWF